MNILCHFITPNKLLNHGNHEMTQASLTLLVPLFWFIYINYLPAYVKTYFARNKEKIDLKGAARAPAYLEA